MNIKPAKVYINKELITGYININYRFKRIFDSLTKVELEVETFKPIAVSNNNPLEILIITNGTFYLFNPVGINTSTSVYTEDILKYYYTFKGIVRKLSLMEVPLYLN